MGNYRDALALADQTGTTPSIIAVESVGAAKYGFGLNFEQALADGGDTGLFGRLGWDDGSTESFVYTECDRTVSLGAQISGVHWHRSQDRLGIAFDVNGLSAAHKDYLAAGGLGFQLGDGQLNYGLETIFETYYSYQISKPLSVSFDYQFIANPGYNRDRGPVNVPSIRLHLEY
jgi:carbohydrate-selective porin OprB